MTPTRGHRWARRNPLIASFAGLVFFSMGIGYTEDVRSCMRTVGTRRAQTHDVNVLHRIFIQDADRAKRYSAVDRNHAGVRINASYATERRLLAASLRAPDVPGCFPIPGT